MADAGADVIELGVPFWIRPPTGRRSSARAARARARRPLRRVLELVKLLRPQVELPILLMGYANPSSRWAGPALPRRPEVGVDGMIIATCRPRKARTWIGPPRASASIRAARRADHDPRASASGGAPGASSITCRSGRDRRAQELAGASRQGPPRSRSPTSRSASASASRRRSTPARSGASPTASWSGARSSIDRARARTRAPSTPRWRASSASSRRPSRTAAFRLRDVRQRAHLALGLVRRARVVDHVVGERALLLDAGAARAMRAAPRSRVQPSRATARSICAARARRRRRWRRSSTRAAVPRSAPAALEEQRDVEHEHARARARAASSATRHLGADPRVHQRVEPRARLRDRGTRARRARRGRARRRASSTPGAEGRGDLAEQRRARAPAARGRWHRRRSRRRAERREQARDAALARPDAARETHGVRHARSMAPARRGHRRRARASQTRSGIRAAVSGGGPRRARDSAASASTITQFLPAALAR